MKLIYRIIIRISLVLLVLLTAWAIFFYSNMVEEVNDEMDDSLEDYSEQLIIRSLAGKDLPTSDNGTNNSYHIQEVTPQYASEHEGIVYLDDMVYIEAKRETEPARVLKTVYKNKDGVYYELVVSTPTIEKEDLKLSILYWLVFLYVVLLLTIIAVNIWVYSSTMKPLYVLLHWLDDYTVGAENKPLLNKTNIPEFQKLNDAAVRNVERAEKVYEEQKQFIGNASHEIQTPLAICQNRLEMLADQQSLTEEQLGEIIKTQQTISYISRLNKSLLFLSKIDNHQFPEGEDVAFNSLTKSHLEDFEAAYSHRNISVTIDEKGLFVKRMNKTLASTLIINLLKNAFVHNMDNGKIRITITPQNLVFGNNGETAASLDREHIFDRFYQGSRKEGSTGLGLAIVDAICRQYHMTVSYDYQDGFHCFEIK